MIVHKKAVFESTDGKLQAQKRMLETQGMAAACGLWSAVHRDALRQAGQGEVAEERAGQAVGDEEESLFEDGGFGAGRPLPFEPAFAPARGVRFQAQQAFGLAFDPAEADAQNSSWGRVKNREFFESGPAPVVDEHAFVQNPGLVAVGIAPDALHCIGMGIGQGAADGLGVVERFDIGKQAEGSPLPDQAVVLESFHQR